MCRKRGDDDHQQLQESLRKATGASMTPLVNTVDEAEQFLGEQDPVKRAIANATSAVLDALTPEQMERYEFFRRSRFSQPKVRRVASTVAGATVSTPLVIGLSGIAKLHVGQLVETARKVMSERNCLPGPLTPELLWEANRRLRRKRRQSL
mmetsp:Transcript_41458/g.104547  ORF Transcript_41458/g.104547 Transcript_41458/m.104547 type:complete len:151 (+) Transcript_41458:9-461(+)